MWVLTATPTTPPSTPVSFGPGTTGGVSKPVAPDTYTLSETNNPINPPPLGYAPGPWACVDEAGNPVTVTGGNQVTLTEPDDFTCTITNTAQDLARLTLNKVVVGGSATPADFTLSANQGPTSGAIDGNPISGVTGDPSITDRPVRRGLFALADTQTGGATGGYLPSWHCVNGTGATVSVVNSVSIPVTFTDPNQLDITCTVTNTFTPLTITGAGSAINPVGRSHTFTLVATRSDTRAPLPNALLNLTFSGATGTITANTCQTPPGTDANGQCTITVTSNTPGQFVITALGFTNQGPNGPNPGASFTFDTPVSTQKTWTMYRVEADSSINLVGNNSHTFTLRGFRNFGTGEVPMQAGTVITYAWSGAEPASPPAQCTVDGSGTCNVTVTNSTTQPASGTLTVTSIVVNLPNGTGPGNTTQYTIGPGDVALIAPLPEATKNWIAFRVLVEPSAAINLVGAPHTFTVTAEYATEPGVFQPVNGGTVAIAWNSSVADPDPSSTCPNLSAAGTCTVTVVQPTPAQPGTGTLTVTGLSDPGITVNGQPLTFTDPIPNGPNGPALDLTAATGQKTWVLVGVSITPGVDNLAGESHTFTVQVTGFDGDGPFPDGTGVPNAIVTSTAVAPVGGATVTGDTCSTQPGTNANGQCTITVSNTTSGSITVRLLQVSVTIDGKLFVLTLTPGTVGLPSDETAQSFRTDKVWWQYRVILSDSSINPLGVEHTFTATVQRTNDAGATWVAVPPGALLSYDWSDPFDVSSVDTADSTCITTGTVADGTCTFVVTSTDATIGTLEIHGIAATWLDRNRNGQSGAPTDPIPDPAEFAAEIVSIPAFQFGPSRLTASKTWWDFAVDVSGPAENPVGTDHTFTLTARSSDGFGFQPVAPGTTLTYSWSGPPGSAEDTTRSTCDPANGPGTNVNGQCTVVIASPTVPGTGTLTITGIDSTTIPEPSRQVSFTFPTPGTTQKTWIAYRATISPSATNLAGKAHTFTLNIQQDRGNGFVAVPDGTTLSVALSDPTKLTGSTCSSGTVGGMCTVTVTSNTAGAVMVTPGAISVSLLNGTGGTTRVTVQTGSPAYPTPEAATKTWVSAAVSVAPGSATNLVGQTHTFTVHVNVLGADGTTTPLPAPDGATVEWTFDGPGTIDAGETTCNTFGTVAGACDIVFTNDGTPGSGTLTVTSVTFVAKGQTFTVDLTASGPGQATPPPITATKSWVAYTVTVTPAAANPVDRDHDFTIDATRSDGFPVAGATITYTWTGTGTAAPPTECTTSLTGSCIVTVVSAAAGTGTLTVTSLTDSSGAIVDLTTPGAPGQSNTQQVPLTTAKTWLQYRVQLETAATNLTGVPHTFLATVQQTAVAVPTNADWTAVPNGTTLTASTTGPGTLAPASTCLTGGTTAGTCTFVVGDAGPGTLHLTVTAIDTTTISGTPFTDIALSSPATTSKTWVSVAVFVTPASATNIVGQPHTFTVHVNVIGADGTTASLPAPDGTTVTSTFSGPGAPVSTCTTPGTTAGTCTVTVTNSGTAGTGTLTITSVTFVANGEPFTVGLTAPEPGQSTPPPITASKAWVNYRVTVSPASATNFVGEEHTFTVLVERDTGTGFEPLADAPVSLSWTGTIPTLPIETSCTTDDSGECHITTNSSEPGTLTLTATYDAASDAGGVPFTTSGEKEWQPGWTVRIVKASSVTNSTQLFAFQTDGPAPLTGQSFSLAIGQTQLFEDLLPGTYTITELTDAAHLPPPWRLQSLTCAGLSRGANVSIDGPTATLTLAPPSPGSEITCTYTNERMNLFVHKTDGGATPISGGSPFNYTITVGNNGSVATTEPITVTDTLPTGLAFAGPPQVPAGGSCDPPVGQVLTCTLSAPIAAGATVQIIVPARALAGPSRSVVNIVKIDSTEDALCPNGTCPPPPECPAPTATAIAAVTLAAITTGGDPSDNQACVRTLVEPGGSTVGPETGGSTPPVTPPPANSVPEAPSNPETGILPRTGSSAMPIALAGICILWGVAAMLVSRRRRARRST